MRRINLARAAWFLALLFVVPGLPSAPGRAASDNAVDLEVVLSGSGPVTAASFAGRLPRSGNDFGGTLNGSGRNLRIYGHIIGDTVTMTGVIAQLAGGVPGTFEATGSIVDNGFRTQSLVHHGRAAVHLRAQIAGKVVGDVAAPAAADAAPPQAVPPAPPAEPPPQPVARTQPQPAQPTVNPTTAPAEPPPQVAAQTVQPAVSQPAAPAPTAATVPALPPELANLDFGRYHALVIGNDAYETMPRLLTAVKDARSVSTTLQEDYGFTVTLLTNASRGDILGKLYDLRRALTAGDNLLIYYAGHGQIDADTNQGYWLPVDAGRDNPANWISNADITNVLLGMNARHVLIVADSCYSGSLARGAATTVRSANYLQRVLKKRARTVLTSGGLEPVSDAGPGGHSVFAKAFLDALADNAGAIDGQMLFERLREAVVLNAEQTPEYANIRLAGHDGGDFIFVRR